jgi:alanine dehydrogenase
MSITITPFTKQQLLPQEEKLEVARQKSELGIQRKLPGYARICLTWCCADHHGHRVMIEAGGLNSSYTDRNIVMQVLK